MSKRGTGSITRRAPKFVSSVLFWFFLTLLAFVLAAGSELLHKHLGIGPAQEAWWDDFFGLSMPFITGGLVSFIFYYLVVWIPGRRKRKAIKNDFREFYRDLKEDIAVQIIFASRRGGRKDLHVGGQLEKRLLTVDGFMEKFGGGREADEGFYAFANGLHTEEGKLNFQDIAWLLKVLAREIDYVLNNYTITNEETRVFFKRLKVRLIELGESKHDDHNAHRALCRFIYEIFAGFTHITGRHGYDEVEKMIEEL